jgi:hypothetical protein
MANTVNDVMNVIASPDYGIKNIASTNQEILAILDGTHNSKNSVHTIVNDVRTLLQKLVEVSTQKKPIEVGGKSSKINQKHLKDILSETKGIRKSIDNLAKKIEKQGGNNMPAVAKLSDKASQKVADAMIKDIEKEKKGGGMTAMIDAFRNLKDISLKDIIFGKQKVNLISKIFKNAEKDLKIKDKDLKAIIKLINAAPEMMNALSKVNRKIDRIIKNDVIKKLGDILIGKNSLLNVAKSLQKNEKTFNAAANSAKNIKELVSSLNRAMWKLILSALLSKVATFGINSLEILLDKMLPLCKKLTKNQDSIDKATKVAKNVTTLVGKLLVTSIYLTLAIFTGLPAMVGTLFLNEITDRVVSIAKSLIKNKNNIDKGAKEASKITVLIGNLLITSVFLTVALVTGLPAILGALMLKAMVSVIIPIIKKLSKSNKNIAKGILASLGILAFTGIMAITSLILSQVAKVGAQALLGSLVLLGITVVNVIIFAILGMAKNFITKGAGVMILMSLALIFYGISLGILVKATKDLSFKQIGVLALVTVLFGGIMAVLGIPVVAGFVALGALVMGLMGLALLPYAFSISLVAKAVKDIDLKQMSVAALSIVILGGATAAIGALLPLIVLGSLSLFAMALALPPFIKTLDQIEKLKNLKMKQILTVVGAMGTLALGISGMAIFLIPVGLGAATLYAMAKPLSSFVGTLKILSDMGTVPMKQVKDTIAAMKIIAKFFKKNALSWKASLNANAYNRIMGPLNRAAKSLVKIKKIGSIPIDLVIETLKTMNAIGKHFINNPITNAEVKAARKYKRMMRPFTKTVSQLAKLKKMGSVPMALVQQTLDVMKVIADYYTNNPIERETIKQSRKYKRMMRPFGKTLKYLAKLKELGTIPMGLVMQTLDVMSTIANYYANNPIERETIKQSRKYKRMMRPFGKTLKHLSKLKEMGNIPMNLVQQTLDAMKVIADYYINNPIKRKTIRQSRKYKRMMRPFGKTLKYLTKLTEMGSVPTDLIRQTLGAMKSIANYYANNPIKRKTIRQAKKYKKMLQPFGTIVEYLSKLKDMEGLPIDAIKGTIKAMLYISDFFNEVTFSGFINLKCEFTKYIIDKFTEMAKEVQDKFANVKKIDHKAILSMTKACRAIMNYYTFTLILPKKDKIKRMNAIVKKFMDTIDYVKNGTAGYSGKNYKSILLMIKSMKKILTFLKKDTLGKKQQEKAKENIGLLKRMSSAMSSIAKIDPLNISSVGDALTNALDGVHSVDVGQVEAVTNMFNAFRDINKADNVINKFTESVKEFTETCKELMNAMSLNTDAINNNISYSSDNSDDTSLFGSITDKFKGFIGMGTKEPEVEKPKFVRIANVDDLASSIASKINGVLSVDIPDTEVQLTINGEGGNEWIISKY